MNSPKLDERIESARKQILSLKDNWDDEGSKGYDEKTFNKTVMLLRHLYSHFLDKCNIELSIPFISPASYGSIDIYFRTDKYALLINVPNGNECVDYYGDNFGSISVDDEFYINSLDDISYEKLEDFFKKVL